VPDALPVVHLDGELLALQQARIPVLDRGFLYGDAIYEVIACYHGRPFLADRHLERLANGLAQIRCPAPLSAAQWQALIQTLLDANPPAGPADAGRLAVYLQVSRGDSAGRAHLFPSPVRPRVFAMCLTNPPPAAVATQQGLQVVLMDDRRWSQCNIKATSLLGNVLAREEAAQRGAAEALLHRDGRVTEGATSNVLVWLDGVLVTPPDGPDILPGVTRDWVMEQAAQAGLPCQRSPLTIDDLARADEVWLTSTTREVLPVTNIDGQAVGDGRPGAQWRAALARFHASLPAPPDGGRAGTTGPASATP
jgi:D-alanine transaminase